MLSCENAVNLESLSLFLGSPIAKVIDPLGQPLFFTLQGSLRFGDEGGVVVAWSEGRVVVAWSKGGVVVAWFEGGVVVAWSEGGVMLSDYYNNSETHSFWRALAQLASKY